jgi:uncharacterized membrane protein YphA (DoxX/SURF4 family)
MFKNKWVSLVVRIIAALIMLQTLWFKFTGASESVNLFTTLGIEPWGRIGTGIIELIAAFLLLLPITSYLGAVLGIALMLGAVFAHLTILGIESAGDGGQLFIMAVACMVCCFIEAYLKREAYLKLAHKIVKRFI